jgi:D-xylonolactonase
MAVRAHCASWSAVGAPNAPGARVECVWPARAELGESPVWDPRCRRVWWLDILGSRLLSYDPRDGDRLECSLPAQVSSVDIPRGAWQAPETRTDFPPLLGTGQHGLVWITLRNGNPELQWIEDPEASRPENRFNDGKLGLDGRYWAGTMNLAEDSPSGSLYAFDPDGGWTVIDSGYVVANGPAFGPGGALYHADSPRRLIYRLLMTGKGEVGKKEVFYELEEGTGYPDGMTVDSDGNLWIAVWDGSRVEKIAPTGNRLDSIAVPTPRPTSCCFGEGTNDLFVTSARAGVHQPEDSAGGLWRIRVA